MERNDLPEPDPGRAEEGEAAEQRQHPGKPDTGVIEQPCQRVDGREAMMTLLEIEMFGGFPSGASSWSTTARLSPWSR